MSRRWAILPIGLVLMLSACEGGSAKSAPGPTAKGTTTTTTIRAAFACALARRDCTSEQVIATVEYLYEKGGATPGEAACIARITATGEHSMNSALVPSEAEGKDQVACAGSVSRMGTLSDGLLAYARSHPDG